MWAAKLRPSAAHNHGFGEVFDIALGGLVQEVIRAGVLEWAGVCTRGWSVGVSCGAARPLIAVAAARPGGRLVLRG